MTSETLTSRRRGRRPTAAVEQAAAQAGTSHRVDVLGSSIAEIVSGAGAWLADRAREGWNVNVFVPAGLDLRPLQILGVTPQVLGESVPTLGGSRGVNELAVSATLLHTDDRIHMAVCAQLNNTAVKIRVLGDHVVGNDLARHLQPDTYTPTAAGRAFKIHALYAAGIESGSLPADEVFRSVPTVLTTRDSQNPDDDGACEPPPMVRILRRAAP